MPAVSQEVRFFILGDHGILFHPTAGRLWVLNPVAAAVWCLLPDMPDARSVAEEIARRFNVGRKRAAEDVDRCLAGFRRDGLLAGGQTAVPFRRNPGAVCLEQVRYRGAGKWAVDTVINIPGGTFRFCSEDRKMGKQFTVLVRHLAVDAPAAGVDADLLLARDEGGKGWSVFLNGRRHVHGVADNAVLPCLFFLLIVRAMRGLGSFLLLHGAVLVRKGTTLVLPGAAGSGKTTLAALLAVNGWRLYSDELVVLDPGSGSIEPFLMPMSIKSGAVDVLSTSYPGLRRLRVWSRSDGKRIRYLLPPGASQCIEPGERSLPTDLVFPAYVPDAAAGLADLDRIEALRRIAATGSSDRTLREEDVEAMIALVGRCPAYALVYGDAREAAELIERQLFPPGRRG